MMIKLYNYRRKKGMNVELSNQMFILIEKRHHYER